MKGPVAFAECTSLFCVHHSFFARMASMPCISAGISSLPMDSMLTMSGE